jgi:hypothetical protein
MKPASYYKYYHDFIIQYDFINVFRYKKLHKLPKLQKFVISFNMLYSLEFFSLFVFSCLLTSTYGKLKVRAESSSNIPKVKTKQKKISAVFKLKRKSLFLFLSKIRKDVFSLKKSRLKIDLKHLSKSKSIFTHKIVKLVSFDLIKDNYSLFKKLDLSKNLFFNIISDSKNLEEVVFLFCSYRIAQFK